MPQYTEDCVCDAYIEVTDNGMSVRKAAQKYGVPPSTLSGRMSGRFAKKDTLQPAKRLSEAEEHSVVQWILKQESLGYAPTISQVREVVISVLKSKGDTKPLGQNWIEGFRRRNPSVHTKIGRRQEASRFDKFTPKAVN